MKGKITDSVIIKTGHGIMTIPRNIQDNRGEKTNHDEERDSRAEENGERKK